MEKLNIFICESFFPEFNRVIEKEEYDDVVMVPYPCMCSNKDKKLETEKLLKQSIDCEDDGLIICSKSCDVIKLIKDESTFEIRATNYCFNHFANEGFIEYILGKRGYIIGLRWLKNWNKNLEIGEFYRETACRFYQEFCRELVFFDAGIDPESEDSLKKLSEYLRIPYVTIPFEIEALKYMIKSSVLGWRLQKINKIYKEPLS